MRTHDPFDLARSIAGRTDPQATRYYHASVILDRKSRVIGRGVNHYQGLLVWNGEEGKWIDKTVHAEVAALRKVNIRRLSGATIINYARTNVASNMARPCDNCWAILKKLGFRKVFYSVRSDLRRPLWVEEPF